MSSTSSSVSDTHSEEEEEEEKDEGKEEHSVIKQEEIENEDRLSKFQTDGKEAQTED